MINFLSFKVFEVSFKQVCIIGYLLPLVAFLGCITLSTFKDFKLANQTHCHVFNIFPSLSSCISAFYPQNTIWRICIGIDSFPRYCIAYIYYKRYYQLKVQNLKFRKAYLNFVKTLFIAHLIELTSLLLLTYISSMEIFFLHAISFITFLISSIIYMILTIATYHWPRESKIGLNMKEKVSKRLKWRLFLFYISMCLASMYFYYRHNRFCEPYIYSMFSLCEYFTVLANIYYHSLILVDLDVNSFRYKIAMLEFSIS